MEECWLAKVNRCNRPRRGSISLIYSIRPGLIATLDCYARLRQFWRSRRCSFRCGAGTRDFPRKTSQLEETVRSISITFFKTCEMRRACITNMNMKVLFIDVSRRILCTTIEHCRWLKRAGYTNDLPRTGSAFPIPESNTQLQCCLFLVPYLLHAITLWWEAHFHCSLLEYADGLRRGRHSRPRLASTLLMIVPTRPPAPRPFRLSR